MDTHTVKDDDITKGAQAMAVALVYPEAVHPKDAKSGKFKPSVSKTDGPSDSAVSHARTVLREFGADSEQVKFVMAGGLLNFATARAWSAAPVDSPSDEDRLGPIRSDPPVDRPCENSDALRLIWTSRASDMREDCNAG